MAANTAARPSSGARILGTAPPAERRQGDRAKKEQREFEEEEEEEEAAAEGSLCLSFPHSLKHREERTPKKNTNKISQHEQVQSGEQRNSPAAFQRGVRSNPRTSSTDAPMTDC